MTSSFYVLGVDGGGTKTRGMLADDSGKIRLVEQVGPSNPNVVGVDGAAANIEELIRKSCARAHCDVVQLRAIVLGLAGAGGDEIRRTLIDALNARFSGSSKVLPVTIETDARIALEGAFAGGPGIVAIAGTGSVVIAKRSGGGMEMAGGWGRLLGDEGSGYFIGLEAIKAIVRDFDGIEPAPYLRQTCAKQFGWTSRERIITAVYRENFTIPSIAPFVLDGVAANDPVCTALLENAAGLLSRQVGVLITRLKENPVGVVLLGGLIERETPYRQVLSRKLESCFPEVRIRQPLHPPAHGAVLMALQRIVE